MIYDCNEGFGCIGCEAIKHTGRLGLLGVTNLCLVV